MHSIVNHRRALILLFFSFLTLALISIHCIFKGNDLINEGVALAVEVLDFIKTLFTNVAKAADAIIDDSKQLFGTIR
jgi:hypothetical protein